ncbi:MAG: ABC transporter ATP-binding protein/permease, partial [Acidimicrobiia bacterium]|nr:ABC transporter ATP-binding protein/permease [Acidimicrobiia bacterium]
MAEGGFDKGLRSPEVRTGLRLLGRTLLGYRADSVRSILGALLWMSMVVAVPYLVKVTIDRAVDGDQPGALAGLVGVLLIAGALQSIGIGLRRYFGFRLSYRAEADLRNRMFEHTQRLAFEFHDQTTTGELMARASSDLSQVRLVFAMLPITLANIAMFLSVVGVLIIIDPVLGLTAGLSVPALFFTANRYAGKVLRHSFDLQTRLAGLSEVVEEAIAGVNVVKSYGQEAQETAKLDRSAGGIYDKSMDMARIKSRYSPLFEFIPTAGTVAVLWVGGTRVIDGALSLGDFVAFTQYLSVLVLPLRITGWFFANLPRAAAAATRIQELLATDPQIASAKVPVALGPGNGAVRFRDVAFAYPEGGQVLSDVDLDIAAGTSVGLVGATGSGKTTLAHLIPRFYDTDTGSITVDGVDVRDLDLDVLRTEVAVVFQETFLFSASIRENIAVGNPDASDEQIRLAA